MTAVWDDYESTVFDMNAFRTLARPAQQSAKRSSFTITNYIKLTDSALVVSQRMFHAGQPRFTGKTVEASSENFAQLVNKADHPVIVDFYAK